MPLQVNVSQDGSSSISGLALVPSSIESVEGDLGFSQVDSLGR